MEEINSGRKIIEESLEGKGDYVRIDLLRRELEKRLDFDTRKFVLIRLGGIYEDKRMFLEAGKMFKNAADINTTYQAKIDDFVKAAGLFIKGGNFGDADSCFAAALACGNSRQKEEIKSIKKEFYKVQARAYLEKDKRRAALKTYEKVLSLDLDLEERKNIQGELMRLYEKLGMLNDYYRIKKSSDIGFSR